MPIRTRILAVSAALLMTNAHCLAQLTSGDLVGLVSHTTGAVVAGATIEALEESTQVRAVQMSGSNGQYRSTICISEDTIGRLVAGFHCFVGKGHLD